MNYLKMVFFLALINGGILSNVLQAQDMLDIAPCATEQSPEMMEWLYNFKQNPPENLKANDDIYWIPIQMHVVGTDDGQGYFTIEQVFQLMCDINFYFEGTNAGMQFFLHDNEINYINNSDLYIHNDFNANQAFNANNVNNVVNMYVVQDPAGACGYYTFGPDCIALRKSCSEAGSTTAVHELGHYFSLPHTFFGWEYVPDGEELPMNEREKVERGVGKNCHQTADFFCDTYPDYVADRWSCPYAELEDPDGVAFTPDSSMFMSYASDNCHDRFSNEQKEAILGNLLFQRDELITPQSELNLEQMSETYAHVPAKGDTIPSSGILFQWEPVENVSKYYLSIYSFFTSYKKDVFLDDNSYLLTEELEASNFPYFWKVKPINDGDYCMPFATDLSFYIFEEVAIQTGAVDVSLPSCNGTMDASISIEATGGTAPYEYLWEDGTVGPDLEGIGAGKYDVMVTDANGMTESILVNVDEPDAMDIDVEEQINQTVLVEVLGGSAPYEYDWSNGDNTPIASDFEPGTHSVTITDANECTQTMEFVVLGVESTLQNIACYGDTTGSIQLGEGLGGEGPYVLTWVENDSIQLTLENLPAGTYTLHVRDALYNQATFDIEITQPEMDLEGFFSIDDNNVASISAIGGTPPYQFVWSNGSAGETVNDLEPGPQFVLVKDENDCSKRYDFEVMASGIESALQNSMEVHPNPLGDQPWFNLVFDVMEVQTVEINLYNNLGQLILEQQERLNPGQQNVMMDARKLSAGLYVVELVTSQGKASKKLLVN